VRHARQNRPGLSRAPDRSGSPRPTSTVEAAGKPHTPGTEHPAQSKTNTTINQNHHITRITDRVTLKATRISAEHPSIEWMNRIRIEKMIGTRNTILLSFIFGK
jgi:hypothetical protein